LRFSRRQSYIRIKDERLPQREKRTNLGKYVYFSVSALIIASVAFYLAKGLYYIEGSGQVLFDKLYIQHINDLRLLRINVKEGDKVRKGQVLFTFTEETAGDRGSSISYSGDLERERLRAEQNLRLKDLEAGSLSDQLGRARLDYERLEKQVILETYMPERLASAKKAVDDLESSLRKAEDESKAFKAYLENLKRMYGLRLDAAMASQSSGAPNYSSFISMEDGVVTRIFFSNYEVAMRGETIMEIYKPEEISIKAFFPQKDISYLKAGLGVKVVFPDGTTSRGTIARYYFATVPLPPEFQKRFEPVTRNIAVDIVPASAEDASMWKSFYKISVKVFINRF
jgi:hypothetical protein